jgi:hypothetical protein
MIVHSARRRRGRLAAACCAGGWRLASRSYINLFMRSDTIDIP